MQQPRFKEGSKFHDPGLNEMQKEAIGAFNKEVSERGLKKGKILLPCGVGKTAMALKLIIKRLRKRKIKNPKVLIVNCEKLTCWQWYECIREHTTFPKAAVHVFGTGGKVSENQCVVIITYAALAMDSTLMKPQTRALHKFIQSTRWDFTVLDECHHTGATTWEEKVRNIIDLSLIHI